MTRKKPDLRDELDALRRKAERAFKTGTPGIAGADLFKPVDEIPGRETREDRPVGHAFPDTGLSEDPINERVSKDEQLDELVSSGGALDEFVSSGGALDELVSSGGALDELVSGVMTSAGEGSFYRVLAAADAIWDNAATVHSEYLKILNECQVEGGYPAGRKELVGLKQLLEADPQEICYLDIETTGLSSTPLFLVGLMYSQKNSENDTLVLDLLFARDYTEEKTVLLFLAGMFERFSTLVTFNGISFDMPFIMERMAAHRIECSPPPIHVDLLKVARKAVGKKTPNHKLQTLEIYLLGRKRKGDIPGSRIPGAYHEFVRTGDAGEMAAVIHHNRLDLYSMLELVALFLSGR